MSRIIDCANRLLEKEPKNWKIPSDKRTNAIINVQFKRPDGSIEEIMYLSTITPINFGRKGVKTAKIIVHMKEFNNNLL
jgi:hypothetical protein